MKKEANPKLIPIRTNYGWEYGSGINATIQEVSQRKFDAEISRIGPEMKYSLHTDPDKHFWQSSLASVHFFDDIEALIINKVPDIKNRVPKIVEIHSPYIRDCKKSISKFLENYEVFEKRMYRYPQSEILIENRTGKLVSNDSDIKILLHEIGERGFKLRLVLDIPQLLTALKRKRGWKTERLDQHQLREVLTVFQEIGEYKKLIAGIHIWGRKNQSAHLGDLNSLFENEKLKKDFLEYLRDCFFNDGKQRYVLPEVRDKDAFDSIVVDLLNYFDLSDNGAVNKN